MTDRDDFSLPSTVGTSTAAGTGAVIKLSIGGQVRRVPVHRLVKDGSKPRYGVLRALIAKYSFPGKAAPIRGCEVTTTYVDEDGDAITISTDDELEDALAVVAAEAGEGKKQVLKIDATVKEVVSEEDEKPKATVDSSETQAAKQQPVNATSERKLACGRVGKLQWDLLAVGEGELDAESKDAADRLMKDIVGSIALESDTAQADSTAEENGDVCEKKEEAKKQDDTPVGKIPKPEPSAFIHARHTCDGCGISPIMGARYHATDRTDYDLCQGCFSDPSVGASDQKNFVTEELDRDLVMQPRWARRFARGGRVHCGRNRRCHSSLREHRRQMRMGRHCPVSPSQRSFAENMQKAMEQKQDDTDKELQEAVLRSMQKVEAARTEEDKTEEKEEKKETKDDTESKGAAPTNEAAAASWRNVADSFSSAAAGSGDFADVLGAVASVVASEIEKQADAAADATHSAGMAAADSARSASADPVPNGIAAAIDAAMKASRVASTVASEVKSVIDKELKKQQSEEDLSAGAARPTEESSEEGVEDVPDVEGDENEHVKAAAEEAKDFAKAEEEEIEDESKNEGDLVEDNESEKSEWEDVGNEDKEVMEDGSGSSLAAIAPPVLARWADQLKVLRQLGFTDDHKSVDALETLHAANMGVDSTDEVTVGDAVNYLLKKAEE